MSMSEQDQARIVEALGRPVAPAFRGMYGELLFKCWNCGRQIGARVDVAGTRQECPNCRQPVDVPPLDERPIWIDGKWAPTLSVSERELAEQTRMMREFRALVVGCMILGAVFAAVVLIVVR